MSESSVASKIASRIVSNRLYIILVFLFLTAAGLSVSGKIPFDHSIARNFDKNDVEMQSFNQLIDLFGDNEYLVLGIQAQPEKDIFDPAAIQIIARLTDFLDQQEAVTQVRSLTNYQFISGENDTLKVNELFDDPLNSPSPTELASAKTIVQQERLALGSLVTPDLNHTRLAARVEYRPESPAHKVELVKSLKEFIKQEGFAEKGYPIRLSGQPLFDEQFETQNKKDSGVLYPVMALVMIVLLALFFRSFTATLMPWGVIVFSIAMINGIQYWLGFPHTAVDQALIPTVIILAIGTIMHVLLEFYQARANGNDSKTAAEHSIVALWKPALFTAITTSVGFSALAITKIVPVKEMAILGAVAPIAIYLACFTLLPGILSYGVKDPRTALNLVRTGKITRLTRKVRPFVEAKASAIILIGVLFTGFSIAMLPSIKIDTNFVEYFKSDNPARQDIEYFDQAFGGALTMELIINSGSEQGVQDPQFLQQVSELQALIESQELVGEVVTIVDFLKEINETLNNEDPASYVIPNSTGGIGQSLFLYESSGPNEDLSDMRDFYNQYVRMTVPIKNIPAQETEIWLAGLKASIAQTFPELDIRYTGVKLLFQAQDVYSNQGMVQSFSLALVVISLVFIVLLRSFKYGILCMVPSVLPILFAGGVIALLGLNLDLGTMIVGAMTMGIAVDDSIHVISRYLKAKESGETTFRAIDYAMEESGRAVIFSSIILVSGFSILCFAGFVPIIYVGLFSAIIMSFALLADLFFLPAILIKLDGKQDLGRKQSDQESQSSDTEQLATEYARVSK